MFNTSRRVFERYLTEKDEKQLFSHIAKLNCPYARRDLAWMQLARHTGVRVGVLRQLTVSDARSAMATKALQVRAEINKGDRGYTAYLNKPAIKALRSLLSVRRELGYAEIGDDILIMSRNHRGMSERSFQSRMSYWCAEAGLQVQASPHWLRHTTAKRIISQSTAREPLRIVQQALGHSCMASTAIYTMPDKEEIARAMEEIA